MSEPVIKAVRVNKCYGSVRAVKNLSFSVPESICFGLLGPNGAGKSTMMRMIYGASDRDCEPAGEISVFGFDPQIEPLAIKFLSGVVPQENNLDEELNVEQNLYVFCRFYDIPRPEARDRIDELLHFMELSDKHRARIRELSGGMKRRLIIARALLNKPRLLILDEPTTGLDPQVRHLIWDKLRGLKRQGMTLLLTTHYMEEAFHICDNLIIMNKGEKHLEGNPQELVRKHIEPFVLEINTPEAYSRIKSSLQQNTRIDKNGGTVKVFSSDQLFLQKAVSGLNPGEYFLRQSNLEDLFLKITGSSLNAVQ